MSTALDIQLEAIDAEMGHRHTMNALGAQYKKAISDSYKFGTPIRYAEKCGAGAVPDYHEGLICLGLKGEGFDVMILAGSRHSEIGRPATIYELKPRQIERLADISLKEGEVVRAYEQLALLARQRRSVTIKRRTISKTCYEKHPAAFAQNWSFASLRCHLDLGIMVAGPIKKNGGAE